MTDITSPKALADLAGTAVACMLNRHPVVITHEAPYDRPRGWPLPIKRMPIGQPQSYRPLAILDYIEYALVEQERAQLAAAKQSDWSDLV